MVVFVTVWTSLSLEEARGAQLHFARHTHKVFRVPHFTQRCDHLQNRGGESARRRRRFLFISFCLYFCNYSCPVGSDFESFFVVQFTESTTHQFQCMSTLCYLTFMWLVVPFPQCICCRKHSGPLPWCVRQSSPSQSSALLAGHL